MHDQFSSAFFRTNFQTLPIVSSSIERFRGQLTKLENLVDNVLPGDASAWRTNWPFIKIRLQDLRSAANEVARFADEAQAELIRELREASHVTASASHPKA